MKEIPNFEGYFADESGNIFSSLPWGRVGKTEPPSEPRLLKQGKHNKNGYRFVILSKGGKTFHRSVHRLILETFVGERPDGMEGCHSDGNKDNNGLSNLRWDTSASNHNDQRKHGTLPRVKGEHHGLSKLTNSQVIDIRRLCTEKVSRKEIASKFCISASNVGRIESRRGWRHV
jgi:hypothetical protein